MKNNTSTSRSHSSGSDSDDSSSSDNTQSRSGRSSTVDFLRTESQRRREKMRKRKQKSRQFQTDLDALRILSSNSDAEALETLQRLRRMWWGRCCQRFVTTIHAVQLWSKQLWLFSGESSFGNNPSLTSTVAASHPLTPPNSKARAKLVSCIRAIATMTLKEHVQTEHKLLTSILKKTSETVSSESRSKDQRSRSAEKSSRDKGHGNHIKLVQLLLPSVAITTVQSS